MMKRVITIIAIIVLLFIIITSILLIRNGQKNNDVIDNNVVVDSNNTFENTNQEESEDNLSKEEKIEKIGLNFEDKNYGKIYEYGNTYICHVNEDCSKLIIDDEIVENDNHKIPNEVPIVLDNENGYLDLQDKIYGNLKAFKQGYLLTDAGVLYKGEFKYHNDENANIFSYEFKLQRLTKAEEYLKGISVIVYKSKDPYMLDETSIFMQLEDNTISIPNYGYLDEDTILNDALLVEKQINLEKEVY